MAEVPATLAANLAITRQNIAISTIKQSAQNDRLIANILDESIQNVPTSPIRGANVNISV